MDIRGRSIINYLPRVGRGRSLIFLFNESFIEMRGFPGGSDSKESACNAGVSGVIPGLGRSPGEGNGNPLQYFCLENPMDRGAWRATVPGGHKESDTTE